DPGSDSQDLASYTLDVVASLVDKSLLHQEDGPDGEPRFRMLETVREYALEQLTASGEVPAMRRRHRDWYLSFAEHASAELRGPRQVEWFDRLEIEHATLRAALEWSTAEADGVEAGTCLAEHLAWFWILRGHIREGRARLDRLIAYATADDPARARSLSAAGFFAERQGDIDSA